MKNYIFTNIIDYINENVNDNLLYSWISLDKINSIVNDNIMPAKFKHTIKGVDYYGNSFSRNKLLDIEHYVIRISVDKDLIQHNYKIIPLDGEIIHRRIDSSDVYKYNKNRDRNPKKRNFFGDQPIKKDFHKYRFDEEFIIGDIQNISRYIKQIDIFEGGRFWDAEKIDNDILEKIEKYCQINNIILKNKQII